MKIEKASLAGLEKKYAGYLEGDKVTQFFDEFGIKFAAGHWCAGGFADRFISLHQNFSGFSALLLGHN